MNTSQIENRIHTLVQQEGRRPRILLAPLEGEPFSRWTKPLAAYLAECGFDVDIGPANQAPLQAARLAIDNDVHIMCVCVSDVTFQPLVIKLAETLQADEGGDIRLVVGSTGLPPNHEELYRAGVDLIANLDKADIHLIDQILDLIEISKG
ncbi:MAG: hypothetical protein QNJ26_08205 [Desulfobacterales bacterium]|nr:hypothetical protein [Desulfobacterales bacterium]